MSGADNHPTASSLTTPPSSSAVARDDGGYVPPDWDYNPASWPQRLPIVALALAGFGIAMDPALYQWRMFPDVWEPYFGAGSVMILNSWVSKALPVPDASHGALGYLAGPVTGVIGGRAR